MNEYNRRVRNAQRALILLLSVIAALAVAGVVVSSARGASRPTQLLSVVNDTRVPAAAVDRLEAAVTVQVNRQLDAFWYGRPHIAFVAPGTPGAWSVTIVTGRNMVAHGYCGYHGPVVGGSRVRALYRDVGGPRVVPGITPYAVVGLARSCDLTHKSWTIVFSHEVMEMVVDPWPGSFLINGQYPEVGDPVNGTGYNLMGVRVSDFVTPAYFWHSHGRQDQLNSL